MGKYTLEQREKIVEIYQEHKSFAKTREICRQLFGDEMVPNYITIKRYLEKIEQFGDLKDQPQWIWVRCNGRYKQKRYKPKKKKIVKSKGQKSRKTGK
ncbi:uncharacterized protein LOC113793590 [Dermatophagoides pteronyssinus]|uniref:Uncharacterized protein LOC113793590 n=1 Tax=Dermatophagoides pteronyssinus TaxID=6956 RepID=A0A6P6Y4U1_DERPT|nr:uncharacterized protein LOC113793590 [Dermatophagoides pteronyssinus]